MKKTAILSHILPPSDSGQAIMLYRLLEKTPKDDYILILSRKYHGEGNEPKSSKKLPAKHFTLDTPKEAELTIREYMKKSLFRRATSFFRTVRAQTKQLRSILTSEKCENLVACTGGFFDLFATYLVVRKLKTRFVIYSFDDYVFQWTGILRMMVRMIDKSVFRRADKLIVPNEFLAQAYERRYGKKSIIVRNPYLPFPVKAQRNPFKKSKINIVYTGSVYFAHFDAFLNLIAAMKKTRLPVKLHIFTGQPKEKLEKEGIRGRQVEFHGNIDQSKIINLQRQADILFLPLAFKSKIQEVIRTSAPGKIGEYLASGRPILVHAPRDSFVSWYFRKNQCGLVVDELSSELLEGAIKTLATNKALAKKISQRAKICAKDFSISAARENFNKAVGLK